VRVGTTTVPSLAFKQAIRLETFKELRQLINAGAQFRSGQLDSDFGARYRLESKTFDDDDDGVVDGYDSDGDGLRDSAETVTIGSMGPNVEFKYFLISNVRKSVSPLIAKVHV